jgi:hypothetical protein
MFFAHAFIAYFIYRTVPKLREYDKTDAVVFFYC